MTPDYQLQRMLAAKIRESPAAFHALIELLKDRLEERREQHESANGETAAVLRGHVRELKSLLDDLAEPKGLLKRSKPVDFKGALL